MKKTPLRLLAAFACTAVAAFAQIGNGTYNILARHSGKGLDIPGYSTTANTQLHQWEVIGDGGPNQQWVVTLEPDGFYQLKSVHSGQVVDIRNAATSDGTSVVQNPDTNADSQRWQITATSDGFYRLSPKLRVSRALDINASSTSNGAIAQLWQYGGGLNQQWRFRPVGSTPPPPPPPPPPTGGGNNYLGINLSSTQDWDGDMLFADAMKQARGWSTIGSNADSQAPVDSNGWPTTDAATVIFQGRERMNGTYALSFRGQATITDGYAGTPIVGQTYNSATNTTTATLPHSKTDGAGMYLRFTNTRRTATSPLGSGITDARLMRPVTPGATTSYAPGTLFTNPIKNLVAKVQTVRMMDATRTNGNPFEITNVWSQRRLPSYATQGESRFTGKGMAWEYAVQFWNETDKDAWVNVPFNADDTYIRNLARLLRYGSDGVNPYTSTQSAPVWAPLETDRKLYVEFSNEVWNTWGIFPGEYNKNDAIAAVQAGTTEGRAINFDNIYPTIDDKAWTIAQRRTAYHGIRVSNIFREVFGDAAMHTRVRPILAGQLGGEAFKNGLLFVDNYYNNAAGNFVTTPRPVNHFFYGGGGSAYYSPDNESNSLTASSIIADLSAGGYFTEAGAKLDEFHFAAAYGLKRIAYEGGPGLDVTGNSEAAKAAAWNDSRMRDVIVAKQNEWSAAGGDLLMYFFTAAAPGATNYYQWAFTNDIFNLATPKILGIDAITGQPRAALTLGHRLPLSIPAGGYGAWHGSWRGNRDASQRLEVRDWLGYTLIQGSSTTRTLALTTGSAATVEIWFDGNRLGTYSVPGGAAPSISLGTVPAGQHGIRIRNAGTSSFWLNSISIQ